VSYVLIKSNILWRICGHGLRYPFLKSSVCFGNWPSFVPGAVEGVLKGGIVLFLQSVPSVSYCVVFHL
jgi:hypothetical protein